MDLLENIVGRRGGDDTFGLLARLSRWIAACGCLLVSLIVLVVVLIAGGVLTITDDIMIVGVVVATIVVAVVSLLRVARGQ